MKCSFQTYLFINHFEHEARTPGIWGIKKRLPKNGTIGGPKISLQKIKNAPQSDKFLQFSFLVKWCCMIFTPFAKLIWYSWEKYEFYLAGNSWVFASTRRWNKLWLRIKRFLATFCQNIFNIPTTLFDTYSMHLIKDRTYR